MDNEDLDFSTYFAGFKRDKYKIYLCAIFFGLAALAFTYFVPPVYESSIVYIFPIKDSENAGGLGAVLGGGSSGSGPAMLIVKGLIEAKSTPEFVADHLPANLKSQVPEKDIEKSIKVVYDEDAAQLEIDTFWPKSKEISFELLQLVEMAMEHYNKGSYISIANQKAEMLASAVKDRDKELKKAENDVLVFQKKAKTVSDPANPFNTQYVSKLKDAQYQLDNIEHQIDITQSEVARMAGKALDMPTAIPQQEQWRNQLTAQEYVLSQLEVTDGPNAPAVVKQKADIEITKKNLVDAVQKYLNSVNLKVDSNLASLEANRLILTWQVDYLGTLAKAAPAEAVKLQNLVQEVLAREDALKNARMNYEQARLDADSTPVKWSVLVPGYIQDKPTNKKYGLYPLLGVVLGVAIGWIWSGRKQYVLLKKEVRTHSSSA
ncbi:MAG TPA: Wzz/FepE/Etk N-terminal domain-containing protein [Fimbriimonadaceae bacterium]|jgi:uncharacterized protein involved in exopolysaccharide biosynthesis